MTLCHLFNMFNGSEQPQNPNYGAPPPPSAGYPPQGYYYYPPPPAPGYYPPQPPPVYYPPQPTPGYNAYPGRWNGKYDNSGQQKIRHIKNKTGDNTGDNNGAVKIGNFRDEEE
ncbi:leucine-rich repeat extensin-like protein 6 [Ziziphus jujuba]|uniref:Leucine-rich repeat extensin-like protein 6 n=1 Tax=Ziziphus jujuba TaxID=326968 RepID=A0A6P3ZT82_ZIZJJ|nr:leucine-rich repeat extensin-like protein 6 [Ziziphus jujuba]